MLSTSLKPQLFTLNFIPIIARLQSIHLIIRLSSNHQRWQYGGKRTRINVEVIVCGNLCQHRRIHQRIHHKLDDRLLQQHQVTLIAVGNGTASRETEQLVAELIRRCLLGEFEADGQRYWHADDCDGQ